MLPEQTDLLAALAWKEVASDRQNRPYNCSEKEKLRNVSFSYLLAPGVARKGRESFLSDLCVFGNLNLWLLPVYFSENKVVMVGKTLGESRDFFSSKIRG